MSANALSESYVWRSAASLACSSPPEANDNTGAGFGWDDWVVLLCVLPMTGLIVTSYMEVDSGLGQDIYRLSIPMIKHCLMVSIAQS